MASKPKTAAEEMAQAIVMLEKSFFTIKSEYESRLTPEQKVEYDKLSEEKGINSTISELQEKIGQLKNVNK